MHPSPCLSRDTSAYSMIPATHTRYSRESTARLLDPFLAFLVHDILPLAPRDAYLGVVRYVGFAPAHDDVSP